MAKNNDNSAPGCLIGMISAIFVVFVGILKLIIDGIIRLCRWIIKTRKCNKTINDMTLLPFENAKIKKFSNDLSNEYIKGALNIFDKSCYDNLFPIQIRNRGEAYYEEGKIKKYKHQDDKYSCIVEGTNEYSVSLEFHNNSDEINSFNCTCPYYADMNSGCKHIYALLYKTKCNHNKEIIIKELKENINGTTKMINTFDTYLKKKKDIFTIEVVDKCCLYIHRYDNKISEIEEKIKQLHLEDTLINYLLEIIKIRRDLSNKISETIYFEWELVSRTKSNIPTTSSTIKSTAKLVGAVFFSSLLESDSKTKASNLSDYTNEELDNYALEDWQKDLVKEGTYDPWNFEEEDLEDDDYYFEDDD